MLVPIKAGEKDPRTKGWPAIRSTGDDVSKWSRSGYYGGLGVLGKFNPGVDIDVYDPEIVGKLVKWCHTNIGPAPVRLGNAPRVLIPFATPAGGLGPDNSPKYEDPFGQLHQVEIKATGQQWVAYGVHPGTGNPYTWQGEELHECPADFLPTLTGDKINGLFKYFESIIPAEWTKLSKGRTRSKQGGLTVDGNLTGAQSFENYKPPLNLDKDRIRSMLTMLDPDGTVSGRGWRTVGMALYHQFEGSDEGLELLTEWSQRSSEYDHDEIMNRWPSWGAASYGGNPVTAATIISMYNEVAKLTDDPTRRRKSGRLSHWESQFAIIKLADKTEVHDTSVPIYRARKRTLRAFKEQNGGYLHRSIGPNGEPRVEPMVEAWAKSLNVKRFEGYTYQPGRPRFCCRENAYDDDRQYINTFHFPPHELQHDHGDNAPFFSFLEHLFPEKIEREWIIEWIARLIQHPDQRSFVTPINITVVTGTGRGLFFSILQLLVGPQNAHDVSRDDLEGRFNGFLDHCIIAVIQEIKAATGDRKYQMWEKMKSMIADRHANIQAKGVDSYTAPIYANFIMFSNNIDALPIEDVNERRIYAMRGPAVHISDEGIKSIVTWRDNPANIAALFKAMKEWPVNEHHFERAPVSETKRQMVTASAGMEKSAIDEWLDTEAPEVFDYDFAAEELSRFSPEIESAGISRNAFSRAVGDRGYMSKRVRIGASQRKYVYYKDKIEGTSPEMLRDKLNKPR